MVATAYMQGRHAASDDSSLTAGFFALGKGCGLLLCISAVFSLTLQCSGVSLPAGVYSGWKGGCKPEGLAERRSAAWSLSVTFNNEYTPLRAKQHFFNGRRDHSSSRKWDAARLVPKGKAWAFESHE